MLLLYLLQNRLYIVSNVTREHTNRWETYVNYQWFIHPMMKSLTIYKCYGSASFEFFSVIVRMQFPARKSCFCSLSMYLRFILIFKIKVTNSNHWLFCLLYHFILIWYFNIPMLFFLQIWLYVVSIKCHGPVSVRTHFLFSSRWICPHILLSCIHPFGVETNSTVHAVFTVISKHRCNSW